MKTLTGTVLAVSALAAGMDVLAIEEAPYEVVASEGAFEVRDYAPQILAEVVVNGGVKQAGNLAFGKLFRYISGGNQAQGKIPMTAPVGQEPRSEKIQMTSPVAQEPAGEGWAVSFMMPSSYTLETLPRPNDPDIRLREVPARRMAAVRYSGTWSEKGYRKHKQALEDWVKKQGLEMTGDAVWARYDPPFKPWFMRRNEVLVPVHSP